MKTLLCLLSWLLLGGCSRTEPSDGRAPVPPLVSLDRELASRLAALSLGCVDREYPNKPGNIVDGDASVLPPRGLTPVFFGCFDWHSAVHGHWALVRLLRRFPDLPEAGAIRDVLNRHLVPAGLAAELAYLKAPRNKTFERPYGFGWLLRLATELEDFYDPDARRWREALRPMAAFLAVQSRLYLEKLSVPERSGTHQNTAFSLIHMLDYASKLGDAELQAALARLARELYGRDRGCPTDYEPSGEDFLSPCLTEAALMRRVLAHAEFSGWLEGFLPAPSGPRFAPLRAPPEVRDLTDPRIGHLIGLSLERAWCLREIVTSLPAGHAWHAALAESGRLHSAIALEQMFRSGYGGEHWLATFALFLLTA